MVDNSSSSIIITGGTQGLGYTIAETLIAQGCRHLTIAGRNFERGEAAAAQLRDKGADCLFVASDVGRSRIVGASSPVPFRITALSTGL